MCNNIEDKNFSAKKYFLFAIRKYITNSNRIIAKYFSPSMRELLVNYIEIYEDMLSNYENKKLKNSKCELIKAITFYLKESIFYKEKIYKEEFDYLINDFENIVCENMIKSNEHRVYNKCKALIKKIDNENIYLNLIEITKKTSSYEVVDEVIQSFVSELLYDGVSLKYLSDWYNSNIATEISSITKENIDTLLEKFIELYMRNMDFKYYISIKSVSKLNDTIYLNSNLILNKEEYDELELYDEETKKDIKTYILHGGDNVIYSTYINGKDYYKGLEIIEESISSYFQIINYLNDDNKTILNDKIIVEISKNKFVKKRYEKFDMNILFYSSERREKNDIGDFIEYRDKVYSNQINSNEIANIQRTINIIKTQDSQSKENRLINLWSVLEYTLTFHEGDSIIGKVKDIIPKVICLYYIKDKINIFWNDINKYKSSKIEIIHEIITECRLQSDDYRYDLEKFIKYLNKKGESICNELSFNEVLKREISEIGMLLFQHKKREAVIERKYLEVEMDLIRIYRDRNILIHSGRRNIKNLDYKSVRLFHYNNAIISVIIHYKKKNPNLTIEEILNSIEYTYKKYIQLVGEKLEDDKLMNICRIKYLFIS